MNSIQSNIASECRKSDFKKTVDASEGRRRRADTALKIRKQKKEQQLKKKRADALSTQPSAAFSNDSNQQTVSLALSTGKEVKPTIADAPRFKAMLISPGASEQTLLEATRGFRRILSAEKKVPVRELIEIGIIPYLVRNLSVTAHASSSSLIFESAWALTNIASTEYTMEVVNAGCIKPLVELLLHVDANIREQAAWCLGNIAGEGPELRDLVLRESALAPLLLNLENPQNMSLLENVVWTISNLCRGNPSPRQEVTSPVIYPLVSLLEKPISNVAKIDILWALSYLSDGDEQKIEKVLASGVAFKLAKLLGDDKLKVKCKTPIVRILGNFVSGSDSQTQVVIDSGIFKYLGELLGSNCKIIRKESSWLTSNIACGSHQQITMLMEQSKVLKQIIKIAKDNPWEVRKEALWALAHICTSGTTVHTVAMVDAGGLEPLIKVLAVENTDPALLLAVLDALRNVLEAGQACVNQSYEQLIEENNGIEYLEELQTHPSDHVYEKVISLIEDYFGVDEEGDENLAPQTTESGTFGFGFDSSLASPKQLFPTFNDLPEKSSPKETFPFGVVSPNTCSFYPL